MSVSRRAGVPVTPATVDAAVRAALGRLAEPAQGEGGRLDALVEGDRLVGFWIRLDESWLELGAPGGPSRSPPLVEDVLGALVEAVWWRGVPVAGDAGGWDLVIVLEVPPALALRTDLPPPGDGSAAAQAPVEEPKGNWLDAEAAPAPTVPATVELDDGDPRPRSLLTLVRAHLGVEARAHQGRAWVVMPPATLDGADLDTWLPAVRKQGTAPLADPAALGPALGIEGRAVGHAVPGWFTRGLALFPKQPSEIVPLELPARDVSDRLLQQLRAALTTTVLASGLILLVSVLVALAVQPARLVAPEPQRREAQPALSLCSADHAPFVAELRCQVDHLTTAPVTVDDQGNLVRPEDQPACGDAAATVRAAPVAADLQAAWCGLRDRDADIVSGARGTAGLARLAAARACFNVLGHPITYAREDVAGREVDLARMLDEPSVRIGALVDVVDELDTACDYYQPRLDAELDGAIVAAFVGRDGQPEEEPVRLREAALRAASAPLAPGIEPCLRTGANGDLATAVHYAELCGGNPGPAREGGAWERLGGEPDGPVAERYASARFGPATEGEPPARWGCEAELRGGEPAGVYDGAWGRRVEGPRRLVGGGGWMDQLSLDAAIVGLRGGEGPGACWTALKGALERYAPVHPLVRPLDAKAWPAEEQQVCGQVCAASMAVAPALAGDAWVTPGADLGRCVTTGAPRATPAAADPLGLPWNAGARGGWVPAHAEDVCAFHLLAQGWVDSALPEGTTGVAWAGETALGSRIAGGTGGTAAAAVDNLLSFAGARSVAVCRNVATECMLGGALDIARTASSGTAVQQWRRWVDDVATQRSDRLREARPWCSLVQTWLPRAGARNEGQLDYPCAKGVADAYTAVEGTLTGVLGGAR